MGITVYVFLENSVGSFWKENLGVTGTFALSEGNPIPDWLATCPKEKLRGSSVQRKRSIAQIRAGYRGSQANARKTQKIHQIWNSIRTALLAVPGASFIARGWTPDTRRGKRVSSNLEVKR